MTAAKEKYLGNTAKHSCSTANFDGLMEWLLQFFTQQVSSEETVSGTVLKRLEEFSMLCVYNHRILYSVVA